MIPPYRGHCIEISHPKPPNNSKYQTLLNADELKGIVCRGQEPDEQRRWQVLYALATGLSLAEVAAATGYRPRTIRQLVRRYLDVGAAALVDRRAFGQGAMPILSDEAQLELRQALQGAAPDGGKWTGTKVARWMAEKTGKDVHRQRGWEYLRRLGGRNDGDDAPAKEAPKGDCATLTR